MQKAWLGVFRSGVHTGEPRRTNLTEECLQQWSIRTGAAWTRRGAFLRLINVKWRSNGAPRRIHTALVQIYHWSAIEAPDNIFERLRGVHPSGAAKSALPKRDGKWCSNGAPRRIHAALVQIDHWSAIEALDNIFERLRGVHPSGAAKSALPKRDGNVGRGAEPPSSNLVYNLVRSLLVTKPFLIPPPFSLSFLS